MVGIIIFILISLILTLIFLQQLSVRLIKDEHLIIKIDYSFITLVFSRNKTGRKSKSQNKRGNKSAYFSAGYRAIRALIPKSKITLHYLSVSNSADTPRDFFYSLAVKNSIIFYITTILPVAAKEFAVDDGALPCRISDSTPLSVDVSFDARLFDYCYAFIIFALQMLKGRIRTKDAGKQNE